MVMVLGLAVGLMVFGLLICLLSGNAKNALLITVFWWTGIILAVVGFILLLAPVIVWIAAQLKSALGQ